jgi:hypothetical protein
MPDVFDIAVAYRRVFDTDGDNTIEVGLVLQDLAARCHAFQTTLDTDPQRTAFNEGKRAVWLALQEFLNIGTKQLEQLHQTHFKLTGDDLDD